MLVAQKYVSFLDHSRVERQTWEDIYCGRFVNGIDTQVSILNTSMGDLLEPQTCTLLTNSATATAYVTGHLLVK